jgi:hypothetical protein
MDQRRAQDMSTSGRDTGSNGRPDAPGLQKVIADVMTEYAHYGRARP